MFSSMSRKYLLFIPIVLLGLIAAIALVNHGRPKDAPKKHIRFALCQYGTRLRDMEWNFNHALHEAEEAVRHGADVIVLPEFSFVACLDLKDGKGWFNLEKKRDWLRRIRSFTRENNVYLFVNHPSIVFHHHSTNRYNQTKIFGPDGSVVATYRKRFLSLMELAFDMKTGIDPTIAELPFGKLGLMICKDSMVMEEFKQYALADLVVIQYAYLTFWGNSPVVPLGWREPSRHSLATFNMLVTNGISHIRRPLLLCNKSGLEGEFLYNGSSAIVDSSGKVLHQSGTGTDIVYADIPLDESGKICGEPSPTPIPAEP